MITLPAGTYYVGDPCYCFNCTSWEAIGAQNNGFKNNPMVATLNGHRLVALGTAYGDGRYTDQRGRTYPVDAGLIGAVPVDIIDDDSSYRHQPDCGHEITFPRDFPCYEEGGRIHIGDIIIDTN